MSSTTIISGFDDVVQRIQTAFDGLGRVTTVTQYDAATSGSVLDEVAFAYDGWGNVTSFEQDVNSAVNEDAYEVAHSYAKATGGRRTVRRSGTTLPNADALTYVYSSSTGLFDDAVSRVSGVQHGATLLVRYNYDGAGRVTRTIYPTISMVQETATSTSGTWVHMDRHDRPTNWRWQKNSGSSIVAFDEELAWDRADNVLWRADHFHEGFDVAYDIDALNRVTRAEEGTVSSGAITTTSRDQEWTLDHLGNWDASVLDLDGDGTYTDPDELDEVRTHNAVNELLARDIDNDSSDDYTLTYDAVGNLTDDGEEYTYTWDVFGRLREIRNRSTTDLVEELRYNGLGFLIGEHYDADEDGDVDGSDPWYYNVWDERWRLVATFRGADSDPKEQYVRHNAGFDGHGDSSYINDVIVRDRDANTDWDAASDGTLEERLFYLTNWRHDVVALLDSSGHQVEQVRYSAYGVPFGLPAGDADSDGDCDAADITQFDAWIAATTYDLRGDLDLDGDVDAADKSIATATYQGATLGRDTLSCQQNRLGWAGTLDVLVSAAGPNGRIRSYSTPLGRWKTRDPAGYCDGSSLYAFASSAPVARVDPRGLAATSIDFPDFPKVPVEIELDGERVAVNSSPQGGQAGGFSLHCWPAPGASTKGAFGCSLACPPSGATIAVRCRVMHGNPPKSFADDLAKKKEFYGDGGDKPEWEGAGPWEPLHQGGSQGGFQSDGPIPLGQPIVVGVTGGSHTDGSPPVIVQVAITVTCVPCKLKWVFAL